MGVFESINIMPIIDIGLIRIVSLRQKIKINIGKKGKRKASIGFFRIYD